MEQRVATAIKDDSGSSSQNGTDPTVATKAAYKVTLYHVGIFIVIGLLLLSLHKHWISADDGLKKAIQSLCFGALGGTLMASRYVVYAVRHRNYDTKRLLWQLLTPIHSAILAAVSIVAVRAGLITLTNASAPTEPQYTWFVMAFSFLVGIASEAFVKRLIMASESLFGERGDLEAESGEDQDRKKKS
jgi:hypothetical protein